MHEHVRRVTHLSKRLNPTLGRLDIELTERCDNDCVHCCINQPADNVAARTREMSTEQIKDILRQAVDLGCLTVRLTGGEPLLRPDFEEIYVSARQLGLKVLLFTNARRITPRLADLWDRVPPLVPIEITVYGMERESYEAVSRSPESHAQFRRGVELLLDRGVPFLVKGVLLPPTMDEVEGFENWASDLPWMEDAPSYVTFFDLRHRRDNTRKNETIKRLRLTPAQGLAQLTRRPEMYRLEMERFASRFMKAPGDRLFVCGAGRGAIAIDAYGRAQPCLSLRAPDFAVDVMNSSLVSALERYGELRTYRAENPDYLRRCAKCALRAMCEQCPAKSWTEHGTLDTPVDYLCDVMHAQARWLGWLESGQYGWTTDLHTRSSA